MSKMDNKSGHYVLPLLLLAHEDCKVIFHLESLVSLSKCEKEKKAVKLHRQFCSKERLLNLLKNANCKDKEFLNIIESCAELFQNQLLVSQLLINLILLFVSI